MREIIKILAKEVRRIRTLIELMEKYEDSIHRIYCKKMELETLKRILGLMVKKELDKSSDSD